MGGLGEHHRDASLPERLCAGYDSGRGAARRPVGHGGEALGERRGLERPHRAAFHLRRIPLAAIRLSSRGSLRWPPETIIVTAESFRYCGPGLCRWFYGFSIDGVF